MNFKLLQQLVRYLEERGYNTYAASDHELIDMLIDDINNEMEANKKCK